MGEYRLETLIKAPPEKVFDAWIDLDRMPQWVEGVTSVSHVSGPVDRAGTTYTVWFGRMRSSVEILEAERPRLFRSRISSRILSAENEARFEHDGVGTRLIQTFRTHGLVARVWARIFASGSYKGSFRGELNTFARLVEADEAAARAVS